MVYLSPRGKAVIGTSIGIGAMGLILMFLRVGFLYDTYKPGNGEVYRLAGFPQESVVEYGLFKVVGRTFADGENESFKDTFSGPCYLVSRGPAGEQVQYGVGLSIFGSKTGPVTIQIW